jgi:hypothetical protein
MRAMTPNPLPLRVDRNAALDRSMIALTRAAITVAHAKLNPNASTKAFLQRYGDDAIRVEAILSKSATAPAMTSVTGWAKELATVSTALLSSLSGTSAGADYLVRAAIPLSFAGAAQINVPVIAVAQADFVKQGDMIPVISGDVAIANALTPSKFAVITALTRETIESSNAETLVRLALMESTGPALDSKLFDKLPATPELRPAGLLNGITPIASTNMISDLANLAAAVAAKAGNRGVTFIASPKQAVAIAFGVQTNPFAVLVSTTLPDGTVICAANGGVIYAADDPQIDSTNAATLHMDTAPVEVGSTAPLHAAFQKDVLGLRLKWPISWARRDDQAIAFIENAGWPT